MSSRVIAVNDDTHRLRVSYEEMVRYNGAHSPGGVALAFKAMERALPLLGDPQPVERREVHVRTSFPGPGARDAFEVTLRALRDERYLLDPSLARPQDGPRRARFAFAFLRGRTTVTVRLREGYVTDEFLELLATPDRTSDQERRLAELKESLAEHVMAHDASDVFDAHVEG
ncbi:hypothetical protein [Paraconexibacter sp.]|uniref:hypothetical protein n=1 Tax=Paraconexibacter sp. TaxID=2949640 RepID=UPI00356ADF39